METIKTPASLFCAFTYKPLKYYFHASFPSFPGASRLPARTMTDIMTKSKRSALMSRVRTMNTTPEIRVRRALHAAGLRFRLHRKDLPGTPDIVLPRFKLCVFVHGCFWHGHHNCPKAHLPETRKEFWRKKISENKIRDRKIRRTLEKGGWNVAVVWECETKTDGKLIATLERIKPDR